MAAAGEMKNIVLLLDNFGEDSVKLLNSFKVSGFQGPVVVLDDDGFLPEDVISVYRHFLKIAPGQEGVPGKARYFNQINVPDYWEISANNSNGKVHDKSHERGRIFYAEPAHKRLVKTVDWLNDKGTIRSADHYDRYGVLYARTIFSKDGKRFCRVYFDAKGAEVLVENYGTGDIILNQDGKVQIFKNKTELTLRVLEELGLTQHRIFFNSLSIPFFVSERLRSPEKKDVLFWQENPRNDIPGNMQVILQGKASRTANIYVQNRESYKNFIALGAPSNIVHPLGYVYTYLRKNHGEPQALICTNSDNIEKCKEIVEALPQMHFHIAALTEMSSKLMDMGRYSNVSLYPNVRLVALEGLFVKCDFYLDINHEAEIVSAVKKAFMCDQLILGFSNTLHNRSYIAQEHIFDDYAVMTDMIRRCLQDSKYMEARLAVQKESAMTENASTYTQLFAEA